MNNNNDNNGLKAIMSISEEIPSTCVQGPNYEKKICQSFECWCSYQVDSVHLEDCLWPINHFGVRESSFL